MSSTTASAPLAPDRRTAAPHGRRTEGTSRLVAVVPPAWVVVVAWLAMAGELAYTFDRTLVDGPTMPVLWSALAVPALLVGAHRLLPRQDARAWLPFWAIAGVAGTMVVVAGVAHQGVAVTAELALLSALEEVVWRLAAPLAVAGLLLRCGMPSARALAVGIGASIVGFTLLPGHLAQVASHGPWLIASFALMALLWSMATWSTGALVPAVVTHALVNTSLLAVESGAWPTSARTALVVTMLLALVAGVHRQQLADARA